MVSLISASRGGSTIVIGSIFSFPFGIGAKYASINFFVTDNQEFAIQHLFTYPNPTSSNAFNLLEIFG